MIICLIKKFKKIIHSQNLKLELICSLSIYKNTTRINNKFTIPLLKIGKNNLFKSSYNLIFLFKKIF